MIKKKLDDWVEQEINKGKKKKLKDIESKLHVIINQEYKEFLTIVKSSEITPIKRKSLRKKYSKEINELISEVFKKLKLTSKFHSKLTTIAINAASVGRPNNSGVVIAGFGDKDIYPSCYHYDVAAVFEGKTIKREFKPNTISHNMGASIVPFAQSDDVHTFMSGIGPKLMDFLSDSFHEIMTEKLPEKLSDELEKELGLSKSQKKKLSKIAKDMCKGACDYSFKQFDIQQKINYVTPVVEATGFLSKGELAAMAETLVNLVSFRKQVTMETETVGGPIDVAVITKGDGLIWIKRKHYFDKELNHHFFQNYFKKGMCDEQH
jgi:hypothetical protein